MRNVKCQRGPWIAECASLRDVLGIAAGGAGGASHAQQGCPGLGELCVPGGAGLGKAERDRGAGTGRGKLGVLPACSVLNARRGEIFLF